ncbi:MAG TPA: hypothetical protein VFD49_13970 [Candidatus Dormibacteraeota bacterium]|nr:hypothetical protein [Candidatus Dormibacteraeota bacterium]
MLALAVAAAFLAVFAATIVVYHVSTTRATSAPAIDGVQCQGVQSGARQYHVHLDLLYREQPVTIPSQIGQSAHCTYWLHTSGEDGIISVDLPRESASTRLTLGQFFAVWKQPLSRRQVATLPVSPGEELRVWVNGQRYPGDPADIVLRSHEQIVLEIGPPFAEPPPGYTWNTKAYPS